MDKDGKTEAIIRRISTEQKSNGLALFLSGELEPTDFQSLLLKAYETLAYRSNISGIYRQHETNRFVQPCDISQKELLQFDNLIYQVVPDEFDSIELSPVNPLGVNSVLSKINQKNVLSTVRNVEVVADVTSALALECAKSRRQSLRENPLSTKEVNLCSSHRSIRLQKFENIPGFTPHFRVFGACTAGRDVGHEKFESENLLRHLSMYLDLFEKAKLDNYFVQDIIIYFSDIRITEALIKRFGMDRKEIMANTQAKKFTILDRHGIKLPSNVFSVEEITQDTAQQYDLHRYLAFLSEIERKTVRALREKYPSVSFKFDIERVAGIGYYENLCFKIVAKNNNGISFPLADGGLTDWTKKLLSNKKERLFTSGFGSELFCRNFKK